MEALLAVVACGPNDIVVVDPPRVGLHPKVADHVAQLPASVLVYVACHPGALATDGPRLRAGGGGAPTCGAWTCSRRPATSRSWRGSSDEPATVLVTGFGAFPGVERNPSERLAQSVDGAVVAGHLVVSRVLPVAYGAGPDAAIDAARQLGARVVLGLGVASGRGRASWELRGVRYPHGPADVEGATLQGFPGPEETLATFAFARGAAAFGAEPSHDAGRYVCNAWLYRVSLALPVPVAFLHVPAEGYPRHQLLTGLSALLAEVP